MRAWLALLLIVFQAHAFVPGKPVVGQKRIAITEFQATSPPQQLTLPPLKPRLIVEDDDKRQRIGISRAVLEQPSLVWEPFGTRWSARFAITSPGAAALRLSLRLPVNTEYRVQGFGEVFGPYVVDNEVTWTPLTEGDTQLVEIITPQPSGVHLQALSHIGVSPSAQLKVAASPGTAQACQQDVACIDNPALLNAAKAVAKLVYTENGMTYMCTGTLLSDGDMSSQVPYLLTAAHCIHSTAAAASLNTFWFFESLACGSRALGNYRQLSGGATLLYINRDTDIALLRLTERAPDGAWFAGWDDAAVTAAMPIVGLHHPRGDVKKLSIGSTLEPTGDFNVITWTTGATEPGSSGSGLFTRKGDEYVLRGALRGGSASCSTSGTSDPSNRDYYSRLDKEAVNIKRWLTAAFSPLEDYTGVWWNPNEPGWGISFVQDRHGRVFVTWYAYDASGNPIWWVMPEGQWKTAVAVEGVVYQTVGSPLHQYDPTRFIIKPIGKARFEFGHNGTGTVYLDIGNTLVKSIQRQAF